MAITTTAPRLGTSVFSETGPVELRPNWTAKDAQFVIQAAYRQVFGNDYLMQSERQIELESLLTNGQLTVRDFIRALAKSKLYKAKFLYPHFQTRVIELNFKHLLGRAPYDESEVTEHLNRYQDEGYEADIDSYIDSGEYEAYFGDSIVPYYRDLTTTGEGQRTVGFTRFFRLYRGYANSDRSQLAGAASRLAADLATNQPGAIVPPYIELLPYQVLKSEEGEAEKTAARLGTEPLKETGPIELLPVSTPENTKFVIQAIYRQVLGNVYLMQSERLTVAETQLANGQLTVRDFVRAVAKSELYKKRYVYPSFHTRVIELNFKHLLGRAPYSESEVSEHFNRYQNEGYDADIDSYLDSEEYEASFGDSVVPYYRDLKTTGKGQRTVGYTRLFRLYRGYATSDRSQLGGVESRLAVDLALDRPSAIIPPSGDGSYGWAYKAAKKGTTPSRAFARASQGAGSTSRMYRIEVAGANLPRFPKVRRINKELIVPYEQLRNTLQQIKKRGGKVASVTLAK